MTPCTRPPAGWYCTLEDGHEGPCPAHPVDLIEQAQREAALSYSERQQLAELRDHQLKMARAANPGEYQSSVRECLDWLSEHGFEILMFVAAFLFIIALFFGDH